VRGNTKCARLPQEIERTNVHTNMNIALHIVPRRYTHPGTIYAHRCQPETTH
ncbi:Hypothetical predicted protein, partial [Pelobates cultripes]